MEAYVALLRAHAPLLTIVVPLAMAALVALVTSPRLAWMMATFGALIAAMIALDMAARMLLGRSQAMMDEGVGLSVDVVGAFGAGMVALTGLLATLAAGAVVKDFGRSAPLALAIGLVASAAWSGAVLARDFIGLNPPHATPRRW